MCLAIPARLVAKRDQDQAVVDLGGIHKAISIALVPEAEVGDYVIVHVGHAIGLIDPEEAEKTLALFAEMQTAEQSPSAGPFHAGAAHGPGEDQGSSQSWSS
ncbi:Hydrogenase-2 operon protein HybG [Tepidimonas thermarum]|uniref:Hydrogenase-2 operon protein HybG n=1 Tax=Tepidimonas thermarum TaxID=335431 RepID=A0A554X5C1_9BURK|nr:HypC/HybG/HupF family hydrogenase formation chaperone [Tepidimonas thermarum]TSE31025.1 Hydrogenase-2 operon protein HybG [Tepidimonas thermarum]